MLGLIVSAVMIAGLLGFLALHRRREQRDRQALGLDRPTTTRPEPAVVDRLFDPTLCAYCEDPSRFACPACARPLCAMHRPWLAHQFCSACEAEWEAKPGRRLIILPIMFGAMVVTAGAVGGVLVLLDQLGGGVSNNKLGLVVMIAPVMIAAPAYMGTERIMRRWFKKRGGLPKATLRN